MGFKILLSLLFIIIAICLLILYWFIPISTTEFISNYGSSNFSVGGYPSTQFYQNMRFPTQRISYKIDDCPLQKRDDMLRAFNIIAEKTILSFYESQNNQEITIVCDSKNKIEEGLFIAGEGGPTNITKTGEFNIILHGKILLIKDSSCPNPNIAMHELLHVLGFDHSENPNDIMYPISKCNQEINPFTINLIDTLYSIPNYPDLVFENISAVMHGKYLDLNMSVRNNGFTASPPSNIKIYADDKLVKEVALEPLKIGHGRIISLTNIWITKISVNELKIIIDSNFDELNKGNNQALLKIKK
ncbi:MAG: CARDB domain-containing protein [archaeon]